MRHTAGVLTHFRLAGLAGTTAIGFMNKFRLLVIASLAVILLPISNNTPRLFDIHPGGFGRLNPVFIVNEFG